MLSAAFFSRASPATSSLMSTSVNDTTFLILSFIAAFSLRISSASAALRALDIAAI